MSVDYDHGYNDWLNQYCNSDSDSDWSIDETSQDTKEIHYQDKDNVPETLIDSIELHQNDHVNENSFDNSANKYKYGRSLHSSTLSQNSDKFNELNLILNYKFMSNNTIDDSTSFILCPECDVICLVIEMLLGNENDLFHLKSNKFDNPNMNETIKLEFVSSEFELTNFAKQVQLQDYIIGKNNAHRILSEDRSLQKLLLFFCTIGTMLHKCRKFSIIPVLENNLNRKDKLHWILKLMHGTLLELLTLIDAELSSIDSSLKQQNESIKSSDKSIITLLLVRIRIRKWQPLLITVTSLLDSLHQCVNSAHQFEDFSGNYFDLIENRIFNCVSSISKLATIDKINSVSIVNNVCQSKNSIDISNKRDLDFRSMKWDEQLACLYSFMSKLQTDLLKDYSTPESLLTQMTLKHNSDDKVLKLSNNSVELKSYHLKIISVNLISRRDDMKFLSLLDRLDNRVFTEPQTLNSNIGISNTRQDK